jgi:hypothetical protein
MKRNPDGWMIIVLLCLAVGCSKTTAPTDTSTVNTAASGVNSQEVTPAHTETPAAALTLFLEALRTGNDAHATALLTPVARQKAAAQNRNILPTPSDTAKFSIGRVKPVGHDGAQVVSKWTDLDENGQWQTDEAAWVLRKETDGWRVAGVAWVPFPDKPPVEFNFENPEEIDQKREWISQEMQRREEHGDLQAREQETGKGAIRR